MKSIIQDKKECYLCRMFYGVENPNGLEEHHVFPGTANRAKSEEHGLKVWLCATHHRTGEGAVHRDNSIMIYLKCKAQQRFEETHTREEFMQEFGRNYLYH